MQTSRRAGSSGSPLPRQGLLRVDTAGQPRITCVVLISSPESLIPAGGQWCDQGLLGPAVAASRLTVPPSPLWSQFRELSWQLRSALGLLAFEGQWKRLHGIDRQISPLKQAPGIAGRIAWTWLGTEYK